MFTYTYRFGPLHCVRLHVFLASTTRLLSRSRAGRLGLYLCNRPHHPRPSASYLHDPTDPRGAHFMAFNDLATRFFYTLLLQAVLMQKVPTFPR